MARYRVGFQEVHFAYVEVEADTVGAAIAAADEAYLEGMILEIEFSHGLLEDEIEVTNMDSEIECTAMVPRGDYP